MIIRNWKIGLEKKVRKELGRDDKKERQFRKDKSALRLLLAPFRNSRGRRILLKIVRVRGIKKIKKKKKKRKRTNRRSNASSRT